MSVSTETAEMFIPGTQNRALALCLAASLVLHALLLLLPGLRPGASAPAATKILTATFTPRATPSEPVAVIGDVPRRREREAVATKPEELPRPDSFRPTLAAPSAAALRAPDLPAAPVEAAAPAPSASDGAARPAEAQPAAKASGAGSARAGNESDAGTLDQYRLALIVAAKRYKRYPAQAVDQGWQGRVEVRLVIGANGAIQAGIVRASSGYEILDSQALDMVKNAKPLTPIPPALHGREFTVDIPVIFDLQAG